MKKVLIGIIVAIPVIVFLSRNTLLQRGAAKGETALLRFALSIGADVNRYTPDGKTPLLTAVGARKLPAVQQLIAAGANVNRENQQTGATPLMIASALGDEPTVDALLASGASISARDKEEHTAYWHAWSNHQSEIARKVHYVQTVEVELPKTPLPPQGAPQAVPAPLPGETSRTPKLSINEEPITADQPLTITDTTGWTRVGVNTYVKKVTPEEKEKLEAERRQQIRDERAERDRKARQQQ